MAISQASSASIESRKVNPYKGKENVLNLDLDEKLKLQLEIKEIQKQLKDLENNTKAKALNTKISALYQDLLINEKKNTKTELEGFRSEIKKEISNNKLEFEINFADIQSQIKDKLNFLEQKTVDDLAEDWFDLWILSNAGIYKTKEELEAAFTSELKGENIWINEINRIQSQEVKEFLSDYRFELQEIETEFFSNTKTREEYKEEGHETVIDPNISTQSITQETYYKMDKKKRKDEGFVDNYRNRDVDKEEAMKGILNELGKKLSNKLDRLNQDKLATVLLDISKSDLIQRYKAEDRIDEKQFKKDFKNEVFKPLLENKEYKKKGINILQFNEDNILADIFIKYLKDYKIGDTKLDDEFVRLSDSYSQGVKYTGGWNAELMLKKHVDEDSVFKYLCDFNSDGKVDSSKTGGDFGSIMGLQLYANFINFADTKLSEEDKNKYEIIDGEDTSNLIKNILLLTKESSKNDKLKNYITYFLEGGDYTDEEGNKHTLKSGKDTDGYYTIENFFKFMNQEFDFGGIYSDILETNIQTSAAYDIKELLREKGNILNEKRDASEMFIDKDQRKEKLYEEANLMENKLDPYKKYDPSVSLMYSESLESNSDRNALINQLDDQSKENLSEIKDRTIDKILTIVSSITDYIFYNMGNNKEAWANMFPEAFGGVSQTWFKDKESITRNRQNILDALGKYLASKLILNTTLSAARDGEGRLVPVIGVSVGFNKLIVTDNGKVNRFQAQLPASFLPNIDKLSESPFIFSPGIEYGLQVNKKNVEKLGNAKTVPVNRIGVQAGAGFDIQDMKNILPYVGIFFERDYQSGIVQELNAFEKQFRSILDNTTIDYIRPLYYEEEKVEIYTDKNDFINTMKLRIDIDHPNKEYLDNLVDQLAEYMDRSGTFELLKETKSTKEQKNILTYVYESFISGYRDLIKQDKSLQLEKRVKLTKVGLRFSPIEIAKAASFVGATMVNLEFSKFKNYYEKDTDKAIKNYKTIGNLRGLDKSDEKYDVLSDYAKDIEKDLNGTRKYINVESDEDKGIFTISSVEKNTNILDNINVYYSPEAEEQGLFKYDGKNLILGYVEFSTYKVVNQDSVEIFLMIGSNDKESMRKLSSTTDKLKTGDAKKIEKEPAASIPADLTKQTLDIKSVSAPDLIFINSAFQTRIINNPKKVPTDMVNGTIKVTKNSDGTYNFAINQENPSTNPKDDKITIEYIETRIDYTKAPYIKGSYEFNMKYNYGNINFKKDGILSEIEENPKQAFDSFMVGVISNDLKKSKENLVKILESIPGQVNNGLATKLKNSNDDLYISYVVDKFLEAFAYETKYDGKTITAILNMHNTSGNDSFAKLVNNNNLTPEITRLREEVRKNIGSEGYDNSDKHTAHNIIGYTSFYRRDVNVAGHGYAITAVGDSKIFSKSVTEFKKDKQKEAQKRVTDKFAKDTEESKLFYAQLKEQLKSNGLTDDEIKQLDNVKMSQLLSGELLSIDNGKKKVKINATAIFYLLAACANESIGIRIGDEDGENGIEIREYDPENDQDIKTGTGEILPAKEKEIYISKQKEDIMNSDYDVITRQQKLGLGLLIGRKYEEPTAEAKPGESRESSNDNSTTTGGDSRDESNMLEGSSGSE